MKPIFRLVVYAVAAACSAVLWHGVAAQTVEEKPTASALSDALFYELLVAELNLNDGEPATAFSLYLDAARKTDDPVLYHRAVDIALRARAGDAALQAASAWNRAQPASREANRYLLQILVNLNRVGDALEPLKTELANAGPGERALVVASIPRYFARATDKKAASQVVEKALKNDLTDPAKSGAAWVTVARMRLNAEDLVGAQDAAQHLMSSDQHSETLAVLALDLMGQKLAAGEPLMLRYLQSGTDPDIRMGYARLLVQNQRYSDALTQVSMIVQQRPDHEQAWLFLGSLQLQDQRLLEAQGSMLRYLSLVQARESQLSVEDRQRATTPAYLLLADIATQNKDYTAAQTWLGRIDNPQEAVRVQTRRAALLARQGKLDEARALIRVLPERDLDDARTKLLTEVQLLRDARQFRSAYDLLRESKQSAAQDPEVLYEQAMLAEKLGEVPEMERLLRSVIAAKPDYHHAYNALGYSLAERNQRLPEARDLIQKALEFAPGDPFITDSLGWVEFRLGHKDEAARLLEGAYQKRPDAEIAAHLGEVLWSLGQKKRALSYWKEGLQLNADNETLGETLKRLQVKWE